MVSKRIEQLNKFSGIYAGVAKLGQAILFLLKRKSQACQKEIDTNPKKCAGLRTLSRMGSPVQMHIFSFFCKRKKSYALQKKETSRFLFGVSARPFSFLKKKGSRENPASCITSF